MARSPERAILISKPWSTLVYQMSAALTAQVEASISHLQQGPTAHRTYRLIQVLRALAAELVVLRHATGMLHGRDARYEVWHNGAIGVDLFFVVSGFVMMTSSAPLLATAHPARTFLARRLERLVPMYWVATTAKVLVLLVTPTLALSGLGRPWHVIASYLFFPTTSPAGVYGTVLTVGWTLAFKFLFYILFAIALAIRLPRVRALAPVLIALAFAWTIPFVARHGTLHFYANTMQLEFLYGMVLASSLGFISRIPRPLAGLMAVAGFLPLLLWYPPSLQLWGGILWGIPALAVVAAAVALEPHLGRRVPRWLLEIGDASYSMYLVHGFVLPLVIVAAAHYGGAYVLPLTLLFSVIASTLVAEIAYRVIERPITQKLKGRRRTAVPAIA
jgi:peptidoglycan/LPS O-acetylase OafA/YrhL